MPIYEYECNKCSEVTEAIQKFSDAPLKKCPHCGGKLHKMMSINAFHLKGQGWYVTDYSGKNSSTRKSDACEAGGEAKTEAKPKAEKKKAETKSAD